VTSGKGQVDIADPLLLLGDLDVIRAVCVINLGGRLSGGGLAVCREPSYRLVHHELIAGFDGIDDERDR